MVLLLKNILFTLLVPGTVGVYVPVYLARGRSSAEGPPLWLAVALVAADAFVMLVEEPMLRRRFGAEYREYCSRVGRWLPMLRLRA